MLKHCWASCVDVSRWSLHNPSLTLDWVMTDMDSGLSPGAPGHGGHLYRQAQPGLCVSLYTIPSHGLASSVDASDTSSEAEVDRDPSFGSASPASSHDSFFCIFPSVLSEKSEGFLSLSTLNCIFIGHNLM